MDFERVMRNVDALVAEQISDQVMDERRIDFGGYFNFGTEFASPSHVGNSSFVRNMAICYFCPISKFYLDPDILYRILAAIQFQKKCQRPSGFVDIPTTNFDSPPDTGFTLGLFAQVASLAISHPLLPGSGEILESCKPYIISSARAVAEGGFHTPNHRWAITAALAEVQKLFGNEVDFHRAIDAYLAEGIDMNEDGFYSEKSTAGYNSGCNRDLIIISEACNRPDLLDYVRRCQECMMDLMHHDWTIVSSVSKRWDSNRAVVPVNSVDSFYYMAKKTGDARICATANVLLNKGGDHNAALAYWFMKYEEWQKSDLPEGKVPARYTRYMRDTGIWRVRDERLSATVTTGTSNMFSLKNGEVDIRAVRVHLPYFAGARFVVRELDVEGDTAELTLTSDFLLPQLPGYWLPLNRSVPFDDLPYNRLEDRELIPRPLFTVKATITRRDNAFDFHIKTLGGMKQVPFLLEILFDPRVWIDTGPIGFQAKADQTLLLKEGSATFRIGRDTLTIRGGVYGHKILNPSDLETSAGLFRVVMTDWSDVDMAFCMEAGKWNPAEGECWSGKGPASIRNNENG